MARKQFCKLYTISVRTQIAPEGRCFSQTKFYVLKSRIMLPANEFLVLHIDNQRSFVGSMTKCFDVSSVWWDGVSWPRMRLPMSESIC